MGRASLACAQGKDACPTIEFLGFQKCRSFLELLEDAISERRKMKISFSTGCLYEYSLSDIFSLAKRAGFDGIELLIDRNKSNIKPRRIRDLSERYEIPILSIHSPFVMCDGWGNFWDSIQKTLDFAVELSIPLMNFHPPYSVLTIYRLNSNFLDRVKSYREMANRNDIILTVENLPIKLYFARIFSRKSTYKLAEFIKDSNIFLTFDTTHFATMGADILQAYALFGERVANVHFSDYDGRAQHLLPGNGYLPLKELLRKISEDGRRSIITLETRPTSMESSDRSRAMHNAKQCLLYIKKNLGNESQSIDRKPELVETN